MEALEDFEDILRSEKKPRWQKGDIRLRRLLMKKRLAFRARQ